MDEAGDFELLRCYAEGGSQAAFAALVHRHIDMVYAAAVRQVRDPGMAEDIVQATFIVLARKARAIRRETVLSGWLLNTARFVAKDARKAEVRRRRRENAAGRERIAEMNRKTTTPPSGDIEASTRGSFPIPRELGRALDDALARLGRAARDVLILRFFERQSFAQVAARLGISEPTARKRVSRALQGLRRALARSGAARVTPEALSTALAISATRPSPAGMANAVASIAGSGSGSTRAISLAGGAVKLMTISKLKAIATALIASAAVIGGAAAVIRLATPAPFAAATALEPVVAAMPNDQRPILGYARMPDGSPVANAEVLVSTPDHPASVYGEGLRNEGGFATTGADGRFEVLPTGRPAAIVVRGPRGAGVALAASLRDNPSIVVRPWGHLRGTVWKGSVAVAGAQIALSHFSNGMQWDQWHVNFSKNVAADGKGHFEVRRVFPGLADIGWQPEGQGYVTHWYRCDVPPGQTTEFTIGGTGRPISGRAAGVRDEFNVCTVYLTARPPEAPKNLTGLGKLAAAVLSTAHKALQGDLQPYMCPLAPDGSFQLDDIPPGDYQLRIECGVREPDRSFVDIAATARADITVPAAPAGDSGREFDAGPIKLVLARRMKVGDAVPDLAGATPSGSAKSLSDFRGRHVLLNFWSSDRSDSVQALAPLKAIHDRLADNRRLVMVGINLDGSPAAAKAAVAAQALPWPQLLVPRTGWGGLPEEFRASPGFLFLIGPDGKLAAKNFDADRALEVVERAVGR